MPSGYHVEQHRKQTFPSLQKDLLDSNVLKCVGGYDTSEMQFDIFQKQLQSSF